MTPAPRRHANWLNAHRSLFVHLGLKTRKARDSSVRRRPTPEQTQGPMRPRVGKQQEPHARFFPSGGFFKKKPPRENHGPRAFFFFLFFSPFFVPVVFFFFLRYHSEPPHHH